MTPLFAHIHHSTSVVDLGSVFLLPWCFLMAIALMREAGRG